MKIIKIIFLFILVIFGFLLYFPHYEKSSPTQMLSNLSNLQNEDFIKESIKFGWVIKLTDGSLDFIGGNSLKDEFENNNTIIIFGKAKK